LLYPGHEVSDRPCARAQDGVVLWILGWSLYAVDLVVAAAWVVISHRARRRGSQPREAVAWMFAGALGLLWIAAQISLASS
jgi:threonine/homoserine/homoserine lactone efflux protein